MKGVSKKVIEIVETENEDIERILVFLKPGVKNVQIAHQKAEAEKYVSGLVCFRKLPFFLSGRTFVLMLGICAAAAICTAAFIIL